MFQISQSSLSSQNAITIDNLWEPLQSSACLVPCVWQPPTRSEWKYISNQRLTHSACWVHFTQLRHKFHKDTLLWQTAGHQRLAKYVLRASELLPSPGPRMPVGDVTHQPPVCSQKYMMINEILEDMINDKLTVGYKGVRLFTVFFLSAFSNCWIPQFTNAMLNS